MYVAVLICDVWNIAFNSIQKNIYIHAQSHRHDWTYQGLSFGSHGPLPGLPARWNVSHMRDEALQAGFESTMVKDLLITGERLTVWATAHPVTLRWGCQRLISIAVLGCFTAESVWKFTHTHKTCHVLWFNLSLDTFEWQRVSWASSCLVTLTPGEDQRLRPVHCSWQAAPDSRAMRVSIWEGRLPDLHLKGGQTAAMDPHLLISLWSMSC